ncbi:LLM class flavin-dependent oxidoreductase [Rhodococcus sp. NPDC003382]|uniref:LLM class flavin-dependent oxidoreductase n=1 Tax=Rhodococcus sp. HM1 TaxID=2937759 RepID=UPI0034D5193A
MAGPDREIIAGLGNSNPIQTEGWHGRPWDAPYWRMRDYVAIMRKAFHGESVEHEGRAIAIPYRAPGEEPKYPRAGPSLKPIPAFPSCSAVVPN